MGKVIFKLIWGALGHFIFNKVKKRIESNRAPPGKTKVPPSQPPVSTPKESTMRMRHSTAAVLTLATGLLFFLGNMLGWNWLWFLFLAGLLVTASLGALIAHAFNDRAALIGGVAGAITFMVFYGIAFVVGLSTLFVIGTLLVEIAAITAYASSLPPRAPEWIDELRLPDDDLPQGDEVIKETREMQVQQRRPLISWRNQPRVRQRDIRPLGREEI